MKFRTLKKGDAPLIAGVCSGVAQFLGWQVAAVRALFLLASVAGGAGLVAYVILAIVMPAADSVAPGEFDLRDYRVQ